MSGYTGGVKSKPGDSQWGCQDSTLFEVNIWGNLKGQEGVKYWVSGRKIFYE